MKERLITGVLAALLAAPAWAQTDREDRRMAMELAGEFSVPASHLLDIHETQGLDWRDVRTALLISSRAGVSVNEVVRLRRAGARFEDIASRYNLDLSELEPEDGLRDAPASQRDQRKAARVAERYDVAESDVHRLRDRGLGWSDVRQTLALSRRSGRGPEEIAGLRESGMTWEEIAGRYGLALGAPEEDLREAPRSDRPAVGVGTRARFPTEDEEEPETIQEARDRDAFAPGGLNPRKTYDHQLRPDRVNEVVPDPHYPRL